jgi:hypothetical protein
MSHSPDTSASPKQTQFLEKFNTTLKDFSQDLEKVLDNETKGAIGKECIQKITEKTDCPDYLDYYYSNAQNVGIELSEKNEIVFSKEITLIQGFDFHRIWNSELTDSTRDNIWKYLHTLYLYADNYNRNTSLAEVMKQYKSASDKQHLEVDKQTQIMYGILGNLCGNQLSKTSSKSKKGKKGKRGKKGRGKAKSASKNDFSLPDTGIFGGEIGKLATEIAGEIDTSSLDLENPGEMMKGLLSGNMSEDSPMIKLVQQISGKIQNKLSTGDVNEMDLFNEAQGVIKTMGDGSGGDSNDNSPFSILNNLTKQMGGEGGMDLSGLANMNLENIIPPMTTPSQTATSAKPESGGNENIQERKRILKEKLKKKKELLANKKKLDQLQRSRL